MSAPANVQAITNIIVRSVRDNHSLAELTHEQHSTLSDFYKHYVPGMMGTAILTKMSGDQLLAVVKRLAGQRVFVYMKFKGDLAWHPATIANVQANGNATIRVSGKDVLMPSMVAAILTNFKLETTDGTTQDIEFPGKFEIESIIPYVTPFVAAVCKLKCELERINNNNNNNGNDSQQQIDFLKNQLKEANKVIDDLGMENQKLQQQIENGSGNNNNNNNYSSAAASFSSGRKVQTTTYPRKNESEITFVAVREQPALVVNHLKKVREVLFQALVMAGNTGLTQVCCANAGRAINALEELSEGYDPSSVYPGLAKLLIEKCQSACANIMANGVDYKKYFEKVASETATDVYATAQAESKYTPAKSFFRKNNGYGGYGGRSSSRSSSSRGSFKNNNNRGGGVRCYHCNRLGHTKNVCWDLHPGLKHRSGSGNGSRSGSATPSH